MIKLYRYEIDKRDFPLNHDCILKVFYIEGSPTTVEYFSCRLVDLGCILDILVSLSIVKDLKFSAVDELPDNF